MSRNERSQNATPRICLHGIRRDFALDKAHPDKHYCSQYGIKFLTGFPFQFIFVLSRYNGYAEWSDDPATRIRPQTEADTFLLFTPSISDLDPIHPSIQCLWNGPSSRIERPGREVDHTPPASPEINNVRRSTSTTPHALIAVYLITKKKIVLNRHEIRGLFSDDRLLLYRPCNSATIWRRGLQVPFVTPSAALPIPGNAIFRDTSFAAVTR